MTWRHFQFSDSDLNLFGHFVFCFFITNNIQQKCWIWNLTPKFDLGWDCFSFLYIFPQRVSRRSSRFVVSLPVLVNPFRIYGPCHLINWSNVLAVIWANRRWQSLDVALPHGTRQNSWSILEETQASVRLCNLINLTLYGGGSLVPLYPLIRDCVGFVAVGVNQTFTEKKETAWQHVLIDCGDIATHFRLKKGTGSKNVSGFRQSRLCVNVALAASTISQSAVRSTTMFKGSL